MRKDDLSQTCAGVLGVGGDVCLPHLDTQHVLACLLSQECDWAARHKRTGRSMGPKCLRCAVISKLSFGLFTWDELLAQHASSEDFKSKWQEAVATYESKNHPTVRSFTGEDFQDGNQQGYRVERRYHLLQQSDLEAMFPGCDVTMKEMQQFAPCDTVIDERGNSQTGILMPADKEPLTVVLFNNVFTHYSKRLSDHKDQLRRDEGLETCQWFRKAGKSGAAVQTKKKVASKEALADAVAACQRAKEAAKAQLELASGPPVEAVAQGTAEAAMSDDEDLIENLCGTDSPETKKKGHGRGGKGSRRSSRGEKRPAFAAQDQCCGELGRHICSRWQCGNISVL